MPAPKFLAGIDLGGTNMQIGIVTPEGKDDLKLLAPAKRKTKAEEGLDAVLDRIVGGIEEACTLAKITPQQLGGIGIGAPGAVEPDKGIVLEAVNLKWKDVNVAQLLSKKLKVPVFLDNDVNVALIGEHRMGAAKGADNVLGVWVGTGIGGALILNGSMYYGHHFTAGEIGHTILLPTNPAGHRSLEHNCSRTAVADRIARLIKSNRKSSISKEIGDDFEKIKSKAIAKAYVEEDELVREVVDEAADLLGISIAGVVTLLSLPRVVLGGGLTEAIGKPFVERVKASARKFAFPDVCKKVDVVASKLEDNAGVYGAAFVALERLEK
jgi:glucokinase